MQQVGTCWSQESPLCFGRKSWSCQRLLGPRAGNCCAQIANNKLKCKKSKGSGERKIQRSVLQPFLFAMVQGVCVVKEIKRTVVFYLCEKTFKNVVSRHRLAICISEEKLFNIAEICHKL